MSKISKKVTLMIVLVCMLLQSGKSVMAAEPQTQKTGVELENQNLPVALNKENVKAFTDDYFKKNLGKWNVPGAAVAVVKDGEEMYQAGYGVSNVEKRQPVNPNTTTFPAASVSKLFTATAIMQLYQSGKLDLKEDIRKYADDILIQNSFKDPVTCQNLLTHSSGLDEESELVGSTLEPGAIRPQKDYFKTHIPTVVTQPGTVCRYSNMGYNLLGYIVEKVSGETYEAYVTGHILKPLQMDHSSVRLGNASMAKGYEYEEGHYREVPFAYQYTSGSSGVITTVTDMEKFMIMHLNHGTCGNVRILDPATETRMQKKQFANDEVFDGMGEGFIRDSRNGVQILKHEGALPGYTTTLLLIPGQNFGIYVVTNSLGGMVFDFEEAFLDHFYGKSSVSGDGKSHVGDMDRYVGTYRSYDGVSTGNISKIFAVVDSSAEFKVRKNASGELTAVYNEQSKEKVETNLIYQSDDRFIREDGKGYITFRRNSHGDVIAAFNHVSHQTYMKIGKMETSEMICPGLLIILVMLAGSAVFSLIRQLTGQRKNNRKHWIRSSLISLAYVISFAGIFVLECYMIMNYDYRFMSLLYVLLTVLLFAILCNAVEIIMLCYDIMRKNLDVRTILKFIVVQTLQILFVIMLFYFNMIGYHVC